RELQANPQRAAMLAKVNKAFVASAGHWNLNRAEADQIFHDIYDQVPDGGWDSPKKAEEFFNERLSRVVMNKPNSRPGLALSPYGWMFDNSDTTSIYNYQTRELAAKGYFPSSGPEREKLDQKLAKDGFHNPTEEQLAATYRAGQKLPPVLKD
ncbi:MAG: hypothetical protein LBM64_01495, partial [Deltaproteobacteria bacterium]|nr:hypothetical protein [Deltaproteobacteria bacterium]